MTGRSLHNREELLKLANDKNVKKIYGPPNNCTAFERTVGLMAASVFSLTYYIAPFYVIFALFRIILYTTSLWTYVYLAPIMISASLPNFGTSRRILSSWVFRQIPKYFDYVEILEYSDEETAKHAKPLILAVQPHGVFSYGGVCSAVVDYSSKIRMEIVHMFPTAVAAVLLSLPILKHILGVFGLVDAGKKSLVNRIKKGKSTVLYVGGIAELFLSSPNKEAIKSRRGFIKLAIQQGADVIPLYLFGNTTVLKVFTHPTLEKISRKAGATLTLFWGICGLPLPFPKAVTYVRGKPLVLPHETDPTKVDGLVEVYLKKYEEEVKRIFEAYKNVNPDYAGKELEVKQ